MLTNTIMKERTPIMGAFEIHLVNGRRSRVEANAVPHHAQRNGAVTRGGSAALDDDMQKAAH
jgi:hypothetical protein